MPLPVVIHAGQWLPAMCRDRTVGMYGAKIYKKPRFLRPVHKKVKTATIFVGKKRSSGFPCLI